MNICHAMLAAAFPLAFASSAAAAEPPQVAETDRLVIKPIVDSRLRYEDVDQGPLRADAMTLRIRGGAEATLGRWSVLAEAELTGAPVADYNAFPFPLSGGQRRPQYALVADPESAELNRLQLQYKTPAATVTVGRQRINLDDQRWVGSVGWRQNEQTFDAVRVEAKLGGMASDLTLATSQRTIFGSDAGPRAAYDGDFVFAGTAAAIGPINGKLFGYLLDYKEPFFLANSSQTYGGIVGTSLPLGSTKLSLRASYARQSDYGRNPLNYAADYWSFDGAATLAGFSVIAGWEQLGGDGNAAVQTPMATLHKFNGWADLFLTTPAAGLQDTYLGIGRKFEGVRLLPGLNVNLIFHQFDSAVGNIEYGTEWDASLGFKLGRIGVLLKYADYEAQAFGVDTRKLWLQAEWAL